jgi:hypothetical protein
LLLLFCYPLVVIFWIVGFFLGRSLIGIVELFGIVFYRIV